MIIRRPPRESTDSLRDRKWKEQLAADVNAAGGGTGLSDGDKGDIIVGGSGTVFTIDSGVVSYSKMQNVSATDKVLGRSSAGAGQIEEIACTPFARSILDDTAASDVRTTLGLGTLATQSGTFSGTSSGTNTGDQTITLTGDVTGSGTGSFAATIGNSKVTYAKIQDVTATDKILGRSTAGAGVVEEITCTAAGRALIDDVDATAQRTTLGLGTLATQSGTFSGTSSGTNTGDQTITLTGDVTGTGTGSFAATIAAKAVSYSKIQDVSATDKILGRSTAGAGVVEEIACTAAGRAIIDDVDAAAQRTTLGLGTLATQSGTFSGTSSGTNTGDQNLFSTIAVAGQSSVVADAASDTLTLAAGANITLTTDAATDTITIAASGSTGISTLNTLTASTQTFATGTTGTDFGISSATSTHTFNLPDASTTARGVVTTGAQGFNGAKTFNASSSSTKALIAKGAASQTANIFEVQDSSAASILAVDASATIGAQGTSAIVTNTRFSADAVGSEVIFQKSRGASIGTNTILSSGDTVGKITFKGANGSTYTDLAAIEAAVDATPGATNDMPGRLTFSTTADASGTLTERMRIDRQGYVGVGTSSPESSFHVTGAVATTPTAVGVHLGTASNYSVINLTNSTGGYIDFGPTGSDFGGRIKYETSTKNLELYGNASSSVRVEIGANITFRNAGIYIASTAISSGAGTYAMKYNTSSGVVTYDTSSRLIKDDIVSNPYGLESVLALKPRKYHRIDDDRTELGFVADEVEAVIPELVAYTAKSCFTKNEEDTEIIPGGVHYDRMTSVLCKAIQELNAEVQALKAELAQLKEANG